MKKLLLCLTVLLCALLMAACTAPENSHDAHPTATELPVVTEAPAWTDAPMFTDAPVPTEVPVDAEAAETPAAFLVVTVANAVYEPIPLVEPGRYTITRGEMVNTIEVTSDSIAMYFSSCDNQDCVQQGVVSLENKDKRVLQNMIICLPNEVILELYTYDELLTAISGWQGGQTE